MSWSCIPRWKFTDSCGGPRVPGGSTLVQPRRPYAACTLDLITRLRARYDLDTPRLSEADDFLTTNLANSAFQFV
jgi:hypothetical protein